VQRTDAASDNTTSNHKNRSTWHEYYGTNEGNCAEGPLGEGTVAVDETKPAERRRGTAAAATAAAAKKNKAATGSLSLSVRARSVRSQIPLRRQYVGCRDVVALGSRGSSSVTGGAPLVIVLVPKTNNNNNNEEKKAALATTTPIRRLLARLLRVLLQPRPLPRTTKATTRF